MKSSRGGCLLLAAVILLVLWLAELPWVGSWFRVFQVLIYGVVAWRIGRRVFAGRAGVIPLLVAGVAFAGFEYQVGYYSLTRDLSLAAIVTVVVAFWTRTPGVDLRKSGSWTIPSFRSALFFVVPWGILTWCALSIGDAIGEKRRPLPLGGRAPAVSPWPGVKVAVALSGGGYRAALFHAGVLDGLERIGVRPTALSTVSGGSIMGAFVAAGGRPHDLVDALAERRLNTTRDVLAVQNVSRMVMSLRIPGSETERLLPVANYTRTNVLANGLDRLAFRGLRMRDLPRSGGPTLMLCTTDLISGEMVGIMPTGRVPRPIFPASRRDRFLNAQDLRGREFPDYVPQMENELPAEERLADLVSASAAFPGAFAPYRPRKPGLVPYALADGGLTDNEGLILLNDARLLGWAAMQPAPNTSRAQTAEDTAAYARWRRDVTPWNVDLAIVSDGSAISHGDEPRGTLGEFGNALDVIYTASGGTDLVLPDDAPRVPALLLSPSKFVAPRLTARQREHIADEAGGGSSMFTEFRLPRDPGEAMVSEEFGVRARRSIPPDTFATLAVLDLRAIDYIVAHAAADDRAEGARLLVELQALHGRMRYPPAAPPSELGPRGDTLLARHLRARLDEIVRREVMRRFVVFDATSTLTDRFSRYDAESLYLLGRYLVLLNKPYIVRELARVQREHTALATGQANPARPRR